MNKESRFPAPALRAEGGCTRYGIPRSSSGPGVGAGRSRGFTLLELLLAFMVFALSFATVLQILTGSMRNTVRARQYTEAALTAQSLMDEVGLEIPLQAGYAAGGESGDYRWEVSIAPYEDAAANPRSVELEELVGIDLLQVDVYLFWGESPRERSRRFSTVRAVLADREGTR